MANDARLTFSFLVFSKLKGGRQSGGELNIEALDSSRSSLGYNTLAEGKQAEVKEIFAQ